MLEIKRESLIKGYKNEGLTDRQIKNRLKKEEQKEQDEKNQAPVKEITITIEWYKSRTWGFCPKAEARIIYKDGTHGYINGYKASGCGYDKESTVIANICNDTLKYLLWNVKSEDRKKAPYGLGFSDEYSHYFEGGVGTSCYFRIVEFLDGKMEHITSGNKFDVYKIIF